MMENYKANHILYRRRHRRCSVRKDVLTNFAKLTGKHLCQGLLISGHIACTFIKKRLWHSKKKSRTQLSQHFPEKPFQAPKIIFKYPKLIGQKPLSYGHLLKSKRLKFTFLREPTYQVLVDQSSLPKKTQIDENRYFFLILDLGLPKKPKTWSIFYGKRFM